MRRLSIIALALGTLSASVTLASLGAHLGWNDEVTLWLVTGTGVTGYLTYLQLNESKTRSRR